MAEKYKPETEEKPAAGDYFERQVLDFIPTGCTLLDCVLGGGWPLGRISNVVGDKAVGKTLLAIEACANFTEFYPNGRIWYREAESAFDVAYAEGLGLPVEAVDFGPDDIDTMWDTMDDVIEDMLDILDEKTKYDQGLYIIDSLDALSSRAELDRKPGEGTYGLEKQKMLGELFRRHRNKFRKRNVHVMFISQLRDKIGVFFGEKQTRTGGKALDFYASQILWLSQLKKLTRTIGGVKRPTGVQVRANCKKNKVGRPFRECDMKIRFDYGVDDLDGNLEFLKGADMLGSLLGGKTIDGYIKSLEKMDDDKFHAECAKVQLETRKAWQKIEEGFTPNRRKYA